MNCRMITSWKHCKYFDFFHVAKKFPRCKNGMNPNDAHESMIKETVRNYVYLHELLNDGA